MSDTEIALLDAQPLPALHGMLAQAVGANRNLGQSCRLRAQNDREAVIAWLANVAESAHTRESYLREADRLYRWAALRGATLSDLRHEDFVLYRAFLANPQPGVVQLAGRSALSLQQPADLGAQATTARRPTDYAIAE